MATVYVADDVGGAALSDSSYLWNGTSTLDVIQTGVMPAGYLTVSDMTSESPFIIAHRGSSSNWPEMSMRAYTNSVAWGAKALEFSCARTIDGVWFGLHDADLNRTSLVTDTLDPRTVTWEYIRTHYTNKLNSLLPNGEPYTLLTDLLAAYAHTHLIFVDPKNSAGSSDRAELFAILQQYATTSRFVIKSYYTATTLAGAAKTAGFSTWGYYYTADLGNLNSTHTNWDLLGLEYTATQGNWDIIKAKGKPVIAHTPTTSGDKTTAIGVGANGIMAAGIPAMFGSATLWT